MIMDEKLVALPRDLVEQEVKFLLRGNRSGEDSLDVNDACKEHGKRWEA